MRTIRVAKRVARGSRGADWFYGLVIVAGVVGAMAGQSGPAPASDDLVAYHVGCTAAPDAGPGSDQTYYCSDDRPDRIGECLFDHGYTGRPGDGAEVIYAPPVYITACTMAVASGEAR